MEHLVVIWEVHCRSAEDRDDMRNELLVTLRDAGPLSPRVVWHGRVLEIQHDIPHLVRLVRRWAGTRPRISVNAEAGPSSGQRGGEQHLPFDSSDRGRT